MNAVIDTSGVLTVDTLNTTNLSTTVAKINTLYIDYIKNYVYEGF